MIYGDTSTRFLSSNLYDCIRKYNAKNLLLLLMFACELPAPLRESFLITVAVLGSQPAESLFRLVRARALSSGAGDGNLDLLELLYQLNTCSTATIVRARNRGTFTFPCTSQARLPRHSRSTTPTCDGGHHARLAAARRPR